ncbi:MAG: nucleotide exchange factor GrpE [Candidatus Coproplasma sp.]
MAKKKDELKHSDEEELDGELPRAQEDAEVPVTEDELPSEEKAEEQEKEPSELEKALAAAEDYKRKWYSVSAEYDNYRKRNQTATAQAYADGKAEAILKLLPVADTFGYAYDGASDEKTRAGIDKIIKNFNTILSSLGVEEVEISVGSQFDESVAEAIMNTPCEEGEQPNTVKQILKKAYKQGDRVIRFAQVIVTV